MELGGEKRAEFAGGEIVEGAEAVGEFGGGETLLAVEPAEEIACGEFAFLRIALDAAGNEVAVRIASELNERNDVIEALLRRSEAAETIKTETTFARVNGLAKRIGLQEVRVIEIEDGGGTRRKRRAGRTASGDGIASGPGFARTGGTGAGGGNFSGQAELDEMTGIGAFQQAQNAESRKAADGFAYRSRGDTDGAGEPLNGEAEAWLAFEAAMAEKMRVDGSIEDGKT